MVYEGQALYLGCRRYEFPDERTGEVIRGATFWFGSVDGLEQHERGLRVEQLSGSYEAWEQAPERSGVQVIVKFETRQVGKSQRIRVVGMRSLPKAAAVA